MAIAASRQMETNHIAYSKRAMAYIGLKRLRSKVRGESLIIDGYAPAGSTAADVLRRRAAKGRQ